MNPRARIILGGLAAVYMLVVLRAFHIQILGVRGIQERSARQYPVKIPLVPMRGAILDRVGNELAVSVATKSIFIQPDKLKSTDSVAELLARRVSRPVSEIRKLLSSKKSFLWVKRQMPSSSAEEAVREIREAVGTDKRGGDDGIGIVEEPKRFYPNRELASSLLGFTDLDSTGIEGVEKSLDKYLKGEPAFLMCERDARGRIIVPSTTEVAVNSRGDSVSLTIDRNVQHLAESELREAVEGHNARGGIALVMRPKTGEVLAMATLPTYNPNAVAGGAPEARKNRALTDMFEPGSTFKVFTLAAAMEMGNVKTSDSIFCENGSYRYAGRVLHDTHGKGWLTVPEVLKYSSNIGASKISERMDPDRFHDMIRSFGFGTKTGIELIGEVGGIIPPRARFGGIRRATVSFGQGISVTPIQMATAMSAVVNGGKIMKPYIVREIRDPEGKVVYRGEPKELRRILSPKTSERMREMMGLVVQEDGTGTQARIKGFSVGGKTGTAQKVEVGTGKYSPNKRVSSFVGFLPLQDPELMILVVIDEPKGQVYGGVVAAPAFNQIAVKTAYYLGIPPTEPVTRAVARKEKEAQKPGEVQLTRVSSGAPEGAMVMPDLRGFSMGRVVDVMGRYSVKLDLVGSGVARHQVPAAGRLLVPGTECSVTFGGS
ncbi:MAG: penicillin-binding transpeptidase domain-containing protein [Deltaproteobacteria bacterium]|nr:penicillin-binding transpeptidase domain-containing protein [Deltaproteobacteria bacterium]